MITTMVLTNVYLKIKTFVSCLAYVPYCSSDVYTGTRNKSEASDGFYFHGHFIIEAIIDDLIQNTWITEAEEVENNDNKINKRSVHFL